MVSERVDPYENVWFLWGEIRDVVKVKKTIFVPYFDV